MLTGLLSFANLRCPFRWFEVSDSIRLPTNLLSLAADFFDLLCQESGGIPVAGTEDILVGGVSFGSWTRAHNASSSSLSLSTPRKPTS